MDGSRAGVDGGGSGERERARATGTIASEGVIPLSVFVNFVSCISRHYPPYRAAAQPPTRLPWGGI